MMNHTETANLNILLPEGRKKDGETSGRGIYRLLLRGDVLTDCISTFFLAAGLCLALLPMTVLYGGVFDTFRVVGFCVLALALLRIRWWIGPLIATLTLGGLAWHYHRAEQLFDQLAYWGAFFASWMRDGAANYEIIPGNLVFLILRYSAVFGVTLALFFILRRIFSIWIPLVALGAAMGAADFYFLDFTDLVSPIAVYMIGVVILLPRIYSRHVRARSRSAMQIIAVPGAVLAVLFALMLAPESGPHLQWRRMTHIFNDIGYLVNSPFYSHYAGYTNFGMEAFGYGYSPERLGGPVALQDWHMLTVVTERPMLLRGAVMDTYTGTTWQNSMYDGGYRFESPFFRQQRTQSFDLDMPAGSNTEARGLYDSITTEISLEITYETQYFTTLFTSAGMTGLSFTTPALMPETFFNLRSELYLPFPVPAAETIFVTARVFDTNSPDFYYDFARLERLVSGSPDPRYADVRARYTVLPETLPESVREKAFEIIGDEVSPYLRAAAIARWLGANFRYTLNPVTPPRDMDFVEHFFLTGEGYCTYYATAMAVMSRAVGLPARYVTGFALERDFSLENTFYATGRSAHAWVEIYLYGIGWVTFDPLRWNPDAPLVMGVAQGRLVGLDDFVYDDEEEDFWGELEWQRVSPIVIEAEPIDMRPIILTALIVLTVAIILYICIGWNSKYRKYAPARAARMFPDMTARFGFYYADIMTQLSLLGVGVLPGETLLRYPARVNKRIGDLKPGDSAFTVISQAQMRLHFAHITPSAADVETAGAFHTMLEDMLRESLSPMLYMWRRIVVRK